MLVSGIFLALFARHERRETNPILDLALLRSKPFLAANLYNMMIGAGIFGIVSFIPLYAVSVQHLSTLMSGMILTPRSIGVICSSTITSFLLKRWGYRWPMVWGLCIMAVPCADPAWRHRVSALAGAPRAWSSGERTVALLILMTGIGLGIAMPASNNACIELMPSKIATITGLRGMFRYVGGVIGISLTTLILHVSRAP